MYKAMGITMRMRLKTSAAKSRRKRVLSKKMEKRLKKRLEKAGMRKSSGEK